jgi:uncharacterized protein
MSDASPDTRSEGSEGTAPMQCPGCSRADLVQAKSKSTGVLVDQCPQCQGMWCDRGEIERMLDIIVDKLDIPRHGKISTRKCPRCAQRLRAVTYRGTHVTVDACPECAGIWLDRGELQRIRERRQLVDRDMQRDKYARRGRPMPIAGKEPVVADPTNDAPRLPGRHRRPQAGCIRCTIAAIMDIVVGCLEFLLRVLHFALRLRLR